MGLNLHRIVRGAIGSVNPDIAAVYQQSAGSTTDNSGLQTPLYTNTNVTIQVQACTGKDLRHAEFLNLQGVLRTVFMYGNTQGVNRVDVKGGDLLQFPEITGGPTQTWLVGAVLESWSPDVPSWCKFIAVLQDGS